ITCYRVWLVVALLLFRARLDPVLAQCFIYGVAPNDLTNTEGNSGSTYPFGGAAASRYQQVFDASQFSAISSGGGYITGIAFRPNGGCNPNREDIVMFSSLQID